VLARLSPERDVSEPSLEGAKSEWKGNQAEFEHRGIDPHMLKRVAGSPTTRLQERGLDFLMDLPVSEEKVP
jgi:hypothetical protein